MSDGDKLVVEWDMNFPAASDSRLVAKIIHHDGSESYFYQKGAGWVHAELHVPDHATQTGMYDW